MAFDTPPIKKTSVTEATTFDKVTPEEIRRKIENPKDSIHDDIKHMVASFVKGSRYAFDNHLIEDLVQEVSVKVFEGAEGFKSNSKLSTWIYEIVRNNFVDHTRRRNSGKRDARKTDSLEELIEEAEFDVPESNLSLEEKEIQGIIDSETEAAKLWDSLKENKRIKSDDLKLLEMKFKEDLSFKEIGEFLKIKETTVKARFFYVLKKIKNIKK